MEPHLAGEHAASDSRIAFHLDKMQVFYKAFVGISTCLDVEGLFVLRNLLVLQNPL
jgi:hypothetical protein